MHLPSAEAIRGIVTDYSTIPTVVQKISLAGQPGHVVDKRRAFTSVNVCFRVGGRSPQSFLYGPEKAIPQPTAQAPAAVSFGWRADVPADSDGSGCHFCLSRKRSRGRSTDDSSSTSC